MARPTIFFLLTVSLLVSDRVRSFSGIDFSHRRYHHPSIRVQENHLFELNAANNSDDDNKIDWNPKKNPKIAQSPSYSDNWLLNFHNWDQSEKQLVTNSLAAWNAEIRNEQAIILEWQDSFQRNQLADFTPPMSSGLNCLMIGDDFGEANGNEDGRRRVKLPWEDEPEAQITSLRVLPDSVIDDLEEDVCADTAEGQISSTKTKEKNSNDGDEIIINVDSSFEEDEDVDRLVSGASTAIERAQDRTTGGNSGGMVRTELVSYSSPTATTTESDSSSAIRVQDPNKQAATYDCIVDQGLMDRILVLENSHETLRELLEEAALAIKELGIYVLVTKELTEESRKILQEYGLKAGLEWHFELDGISDDTQVVSVARRFCTGEMPKVGRLSRFQP